MSGGVGRPDYLKAFGPGDFSARDLEAYDALVATTKPYILFFTPRSGSSYLADLLASTRRLGSPEEFINLDLVPLSIRHITGTGFEVRHVIDYLAWLIQTRSTANGVFGLKVSYGCYRPLILAGLDEALFGRFTPLSLVRNNILRQAVSLYVAVSTGMFHTNVQHPQETYDKVHSLPYDEERVRFWIQHMVIQETGICNHIEKKGLDCLRLDYDELCREPRAVVRRVADRLNVVLPDDAPGDRTLFQKVRTATTDAIIARFISNRSNLRFLETMGLDESRLVGE